MLKKNTREKRKINYAKNKYDNSKVIYQGKMLSKVDDLDKEVVQIKKDLMLLLHRL